MSATCCTCGCGCQPGYGCLYQVILPSESSPVLSFANQGVGGVGPYDNSTNDVIGFRTITSANAFETVTLDAANKNIVLTIDINAIAAGLPAATTAQVGVLETATDAEAQTKVATDKILVPSNLAALGATTTLAGLAEIATQAEVNAGVATSVIVAPDTLSVLLATKKFTTTFADAVARAALVPSFKGQFGYQLDTKQPYAAYGVVAGNWNPLFLFGQTTQQVPNASATLITFGAGATMAFQGGGTTFANGTFTFDTETLTLANGSVDFNATQVQIAGSPIDALSLVGTTVNPGELDRYFISNFLSTENPDAGWSVSNFSTSRTFDAGAATLQETKDFLATFVNAILNTLLPQP